MRYLIFILSLLLVSCFTYKDYENKAIVETKKIVECDEYLIALSSEEIIRVKACDKYYTWYCRGAFGCYPIKCKLIAVETEPTPIKKKP